MAVAAITGHEPGATPAPRSAQRPVPACTWPLCWIRPGWDGPRRRQARGQHRPRTRLGKLERAVPRRAGRGAPGRRVRAGAVGKARASRPGVPAAGAVSPGRRIRGHRAVTAAVFSSRATSSHAMAEEWCRCHQAPGSVRRSSALAASGLPAARARAIAACARSRTSCAGWARWLTASSARAEAAVSAGLTAFWVRDVRPRANTSSPNHHRAPRNVSRSRGSRRAGSRLSPASQSATAAASASVSTGPMPIAVPRGRRPRSHGCTIR